jgi:hypothetical protein
MVVNLQFPTTASLEKNTMVIWCSTFYDLEQPALHVMIREQKFQAYLNHLDC